MAIWDTLKKSITSLPGDLYNTFTKQLPAVMKNAYGTQVPALYKMATTNYQTPAPNYPIKKPLMETQSQVEYPASQTGGSSGIGGRTGAGGLDYWSNRARMTGEVSGAYDPLRQLLEKEMYEGIPDRYSEEQETIEKRKPLNQQRYEAMLDLLNQATEMNTEQIQEAEDTGLGGARARSATRGLYDSSVLANAEQMISREAMEQDIANQANKLLQGEKYKTDWELADQGVDESLANLFTRKDTDIQNTLARLLGIPADMLTSIDRGMGGVIDAANANTNAFNAWTSASGGGSSKANTEIISMFDEATGKTRQVLIDMNTGLPVQDLGINPGETADERGDTAMYYTLQSMLEDGELTPEEQQQLYTQFPYAGVSSSSLETAPLLDQLLKTIKSTQTSATGTAPTGIFDRLKSLLSR